MGIKTCPNGHKYDDSLSECPFCPKPVREKKTVADNPALGRTVPERKKQSIEHGKKDAEKAPADKTRIVDGGAKGRSKRDRTAIISGGNTPASKQDGVKRADGKLVGWMVTFSWNKLGQDFQVREGRTRIGSDINSDILVEDALISNDHAQMVYRNDQLKIRDSFSTNGTFVNGVDVGDEPTELHDGDIIKVGNTTFKLRMIGDVADE